MLQVAASTADGSMSGAMDPDDDSCTAFSKTACADALTALQRLDASERRTLQVLVVQREAAYARNAPSVHVLAVLAARPCVYACSCTLLARKGLPCRHYLAYLIKYNIAGRFCISTVHARWLTVSQQEIVHRFCTPSSTCDPLPTAYAASMQLTLRIHPPIGRSGAATVEADMLEEGASVHSQVCPLAACRCNQAWAHTWQLACFYCTGTVWYFNCN
jgi:hypothetical protein